MSDTARRFDPLTVGLGVALVVIFTAIAVVSPALEKAAAPPFGTIGLFIGLYATAGALFLVAAGRVHAHPRRIGLTTIATIGILLRVSMLISTPILEDDYFRYLLDGAMTLNGYNPYTYAPTAIADGLGVPEGVAAIGQEEAGIIHRINHPAIRTIYPPVAQGVFALAHAIAPFDIAGLRLLLLLFDVATAGVLLTLLTHLRLPRAFIVFYWWNPLVAKELINAGHMDAILLPFLTGALLFMLKQRWYLAAAAIAASVGVKLWPVIFVPLLFVHIWRARPLGNPSGPASSTAVSTRLKQIAVSGLIVALLVAAMAWPVWLSTPDDTSGFFKYTKHWRNNDVVYRLLMIPMQPITVAIGKTGVHAYNATRLLVSGIYLLLVSLLLKRWRKGDNGVTTAALLTVALLYLLSPTQFPWYFLWVVPFLTVRRWPALSLYTVTLPLYYFQHALRPDAGRWWFDNVIVWVEHLPVFAAMATTYFTSSDSPLRYFSKGRKR